MKTNSTETIDQRKYLYTSLFRRKLVCEFVPWQTESQLTLATPDGEEVLSLAIASNTRRIALELDQLNPGFYRLSLGVVGVATISQSVVLF